MLNVEKIEDVMSDGEFVTFEYVTADGVEHQLDDPSSDVVISILSQSNLNEVLLRVSDDIDDGITMHYELADLIN